MWISTFRLALTLLAHALVDLIPRQPVIYGEGQRLCIGRSLLARVFEAACLVVWGIMVGYVTASIVVTRTTGSVVAGGSFLLVLGAVTWLLRRQIMHSTLVIDREQDRISRGSKVIARASDVQAIHVGGRGQPAVLVLRDHGSSHLVNSALPRIEGGDGHVVGSTLAAYLDVALLRIEVRAPAAADDASHAA